MKKIQLLWIFILHITFSSCGQKQHSSADANSATTTENATAAKPLVLKAGELTPSIQCSADAAYSYALYIPSAYKQGEKYPVIVLFDPHGDGSFPLNKYKKLADQYGFILVGSNDSKNGNAKDVTQEIIDHLSTAVHQVLPLSSQGMYAAGFSGGGRVAAMMALSRNDVTGLITCGAGFPGKSWTKTPPSIIIGIAGNGDMNLHEVMDQDFSSPDFKARYQRIRFDGEHAWPPVDVFEQALIAFQCTAMKESQKPKDNALLDVYTKRFDSAYSEALKKKELIAASSVAERQIQNFNGLTKTDAIAQTLDQLKTSAPFSSAVAEEQSLFKEEEQIRNTLQGAFGKGDTTWWISRMNEIQAAKKKFPGARAAMLSRASGTMSLMCYMNLTQAMKSGPPEAKAYLTTLYRAIDPENIEAWYLSADFAAESQQPDKAIGYLQMAVEKGFNDRSRLNKDMSLMLLQTLPAYQQLVGKLTH